VPGFLSHLAARVFGSGPAVQPRIPSLFEPEPGMPLRSEPESRGLREVEQEVLVTPRSETARVAAPPPAEMPAPAQTAPAPPAYDLRPARAMKPRFFTVEPETQETRETAARRVAPRTEVAVETESQAPVPEHRAARREIHPANPAVEMPRPALRPVTLQPSREPEEQHLVREAPPQRSSIRARTETVTADGFHAVHERIPGTPQPPVPVTASLAPRSETPAALRNPLSADDPAPHDAPSIQVTIGRLIVEAVMPSATALPPAPRAAGPRLSLEDYLRQRRSQA